MFQPSTFPELYRANAVLYEIPKLEPQVASWDTNHHPGRIRLEKYLNGLMEIVPPFADDANLYFELIVDVKQPKNLLVNYDIENYLTPHFARNNFNQRIFPLVLGSKRVGGGSVLRLGTFTVESSNFLGPTWNHLSFNAGSVGETKNWKERLHGLVESTTAKEIAADLPVEMHLAWRCSTTRNWVNLWKPTGDSLSTILGHNRDNKFNPRDDRIISLTFHRFDDDSLKNDVHIGIWWRVASGEQTLGSNSSQIYFDCSQHSSEY